MTFSGVDCGIVNVQYALSLELLPASMCSFREASACCLGVFTHIVLLLLSALSDVGTVDFRLLLPSQKSENPNWPIKYKLYQNVIEYSKIDWSLCFFVFCNWTSNLKSTVDLCTSYLRKYFLLYQKLLYQRCRQIVCICVHLMAQILLLTPPLRQLSLQYTGWGYAKCQNFCDGLNKQTPVTWSASAEGMVTAGLIGLLW